MSSVSETLSTLNFGKNVTEITLGAAKRNAESGAAWEAKERALKLERDASGGWLGGWDDHWWLLPWLPVLCGMVAGLAA